MSSYREDEVDDIIVYLATSGQQALPFSKKCSGKSILGAIF